MSAAVKVRSRPQPLHSIGDGGLRLVNAKAGCRCRRWYSYGLSFWDDDHGWRHTKSACRPVTEFHPGTALLLERNRQP